MREEIEVSNHLVRNLERISPENSIFNYKSGSKAFVSLGQGNIREWLDTVSYTHLTLPTNREV